MKKIMISACLSLGMLSGQAIAQTCAADLIQSTPTERFIASVDNSEVLDTKTNLVWRRCALGYVQDSGSCIDDPDASNDKWNWMNVTKWQMSKLRSVAQGEWRLPNIKELNSITEQTCESPALNLNVFYDAPENSGQYMSNTPNVNDNREMKAVDVNTGNIKNIRKDQTSYYRIVREPSAQEITTFGAVVID
ncbi:MAG: DUF1566 domain-containing protein [Saccharospirillaceae bacterium]|nr:DUF1566 domain-containing protein [Pseudomonadales bacterium]NRB81794.1 DUF1566 domain-containing protein [Saccharospirillaceae bacterium]